MTRSIESSLRLATVTSVLVVATFGCAGASDDGESDWAGDIASHDDELARAPWRSRHRLVPQHDAGTDAGASGGGAGSGASGDTAGGGVLAPDAGRRIVNVSGGCELCARAQACCDEARGGTLCSFSATTCDALEPLARAAYVNDCKVLIQTVASVRSALPASCL